MGSSVHHPEWFAPPTNDGKKMTESLSDMIGIADVFHRHNTRPEIMFIFGRGLIVQVAVKGGGILFKDYDGTWLAALLHGKKVIHETADLYTRNPLNHLGAALLYTGVISNGEYSTVPDKYHAALEEFWRGPRNFETVVPS